MALDHEFESLVHELEQIYETCPLSRDKKANINDLFDRLSVKYGKDIAGLIREEIGLSLNTVEGTVSFNEFIELIRGIVLKYSNETNLELYFVSSELNENGNSSNEEFSSHDESDRSSSMEDIKYLRESKKDISEKLLKAETAVQTLEDRLKNQTKINTQLNKLIEIMRDDVNRLQFVEIENEELRQDVRRLDNKINHLNDDLKKASSRIKILEEENDSLTGKMYKLQRNIDKKRALLTQNEQNYKILYEEMILLQDQNYYLAQDAEKTTVVSDLNESLLKRINNLMTEKSNLQFKISEYELNLMHNFDHWNQSPINEMTCPQNNSGVSLKSELSGIYDPDMEVLKKMEQTDSGKTVSTQTENVTNSVCSQTNILLGSSSSESDISNQTPKMHRLPKPKKIFEDTCDNCHVQEMELCENSEIVSQFREHDQTFDLPNYETTCAINLSNQNSFGINDQTLDLPNFETCAITSNQSSFEENDEIVKPSNMEITCIINPPLNQVSSEENISPLDLSNFETTYTINLSNQSSFEENDDKVKPTNMEIMCINNPPLLETNYKNNIRQNRIISTPLNNVNKSRRSLKLKKYLIEDDKSSGTYSHSFFSYVEPRNVSNEFFSMFICLIHEMTKYAINQLD